MSTPEPDLRQAVRAAITDIVDEAPMAPEWYDLTTGTQRLSRPARSRRRLSGPAVALATAVMVTFAVGAFAILFAADGTQPVNPGSETSVATTTPPPTTTVPDQPPPSTTVPVPTTVVVEPWTIEDAQALLSDAEWKRIRAEAEGNEDYSTWDAQDLKSNEDDLFAITGLERGALLPRFGSTLLNGGRVDPASIVGDQRPLLVLVWRPSPWLAAGTEETTVRNLDAFQEAYERWSDQLGFIGVVWNEPIEGFEAMEVGPAEIVDLGRQFVSERGYTFPNVIGRVDLPQVPEPWMPMWLLTSADGRTIGGFFAYDAIREDADTALDSLPVDHLLSRLVIPIDELADDLQEQYLWAPEYEGGPPSEQPPP